MRSAEIQIQLHDTPGYNSHGNAKHFGTAGGVIMITPILEIWSSDASRAFPVTRVTSEEMLSHVL